MDNFRDRHTTDMGSYEHNINRRLMERDNFYQPSQQEDRYGQLEQDYGEITGQFLNGIDLDKGMPMRPGMVQHPSERDEHAENDNPYLDFNLYRERPNIKVSNYDPFALPGQEKGFAKLDDDTNILQQNIKPNQQSQQSIIQSFNEFNFGFLDKFTGSLKSKKSMIVSPFSIMQCFCLLYIGSKNKTEQLLRDYFNLPNKRAVHTNLFKINQELINSQVFSLMNLACVPKQLTINEAYKSFVDKIGHFISFDQQNPYPDAIKINNIIEQSTRGLIKQFIQPQMLKGILVLVNTVYFYSKWKKPFDPRSTKQEVFNGITKSIVPMMTQLKTKHNYFEDTYNQVLEMDYADNVFSMGIILPKSQYAEPMINIQQFYYYVDNLKEQVVNVKIPKFKSDSRYSISKLLMKYGLKDLFESIDIGEILPPINNQNVFVSDIIHAAVIEVDEAGTKAAAATGMYMENSISNTKQINFIANHQFMYYIRYKPYNLVLFSGIKY